MQGKRIQTMLMNVDMRKGGEQAEENSVTEQTEETQLE